jgi:hypothetical protein
VVVSFLVTGRESAALPLDHVGGTKHKLVMSLIIQQKHQELFKLFIIIARDKSHEANHQMNIHSLSKIQALLPSP